MLMGWANDHDQEKITYTTSLLRGYAESGITPYIENLKRPTWETWPQFTEELNNQFGIFDKKGEARNRLKHIKQGKRTMTEYWNEFRLASSEAELHQQKKLLTSDASSLRPDLGDFVFASCASCAS